MLTSNDDRELDGSHIISHFRQLSCGGEAAVRLSKASSPGPRRPFGAREPTQLRPGLPERCQSQHGKQKALGQRLKPLACSPQRMQGTHPDGLSLLHLGHPRRGRLPPTKKHSRSARRKNRKEQKALGWRLKPLACSPQRMQGTHPDGLPLLHLGQAKPPSPPREALPLS